MNALVGFVLIGCGRTTTPEGLDGQLNAKDISHAIQLLTRGTK
jgi:hypothetical protein